MKLPRSLLKTSGQAALCGVTVLVPPSSVWSQASHVGSDPPRQAHIYIHAPQWLFQGERIVGARGNSAYLWDAMSGRILQRFEGHAEPVTAIAVSPEGDLLLTGSGRSGDLGGHSRDNSIRLWNTGNGEEIRRFQGHKGAIASLEFHPDGKKFLSGAADLSRYRLWDLKSAQELFIFPGERVAFARRGTAVVDRRPWRVIIWDSMSFKQLLRLEGESGSLFLHAEVSAGGSELLMHRSNNTVELWDLEKKQLTRVLKTPDSAITFTSFTPQAGDVMVAFDDHTVRSYVVASGEVAASVNTPGIIRQITFSPRGDRFIGHWSPPSEPHVMAPVGSTLWTLPAGPMISESIGRSHPSGGPATFAGFAPDGASFLLVEAGARRATIYSADGDVKRTLTLE